MCLSHRLATGFIAAALTTSLAVAPAQAQSAEHTGAGLSADATTAGSSVIGIGINLAIAAIVYNFLVHNRLIAPLAH